MHYRHILIALINGKGAAMKKERYSFKLDDYTRKEIIEGIRRFFIETRDEDVGMLTAALYLDFIMESIAPAIYNQGIDDAEAFMRDKLADMVLLRADEYK